MNASANVPEWKSLFEERCLNDTEHGRLCSRKQQISGICLFALGDDDLFSGSDGGGVMVEKRLQKEPLPRIPTNQKTASYDAVWSMVDDVVSELGSEVSKGLF